MRNILERDLSAFSPGHRFVRFELRRRERHIGQILVICLLGFCLIGTQWRYAGDPAEATIPHDPSHGLRSVSVHILTCKSAIARRDCSRQNAHDVKDGPAVYGQLMCNVAANKMIAHERMELVGPAGYLKIVCEPADTRADAR